MKRACGQCGREFVARSERAVYCSATCRARASEARARRGAVAPVASVPAAEQRESAFVASVRERVEAAGLEESPDGLLAVRLAVAVDSNEDGSKLAALARQFTSQMDRIESLVPRETQVDELRRRRDRKRARPA